VSAAAFPRRRNLDKTVRALAAEFRGRFYIGTVRSRDGISLTAVRRKPDEPGLYAVITDDEDEMRDALREDAEEFPGDPDGLASPIVRRAASCPPPPRGRGV
jgi:hypothetical protein